MPSIFDKVTRDELVQRAGTLHEHSTAQWGKMNLSQMLRHCTLWEEMVQGKQQYKRAFIGRIFGRMALKAVLKDEAPLGRNSPTIPAFKMQGNGDIAQEKANWIASIEYYAHFFNPSFVHPFFGSMTREQIGRMVYKHIDHHLRQFGA